MDHKLSNQTIIFYLQMLKESMQREGVYQAILPMTEELSNLIVYGLVGKKED